MGGGASRRAPPALIYSFAFDLQISSSIMKSEADLRPAGRSPVYVSAAMLLAVLALGCGPAQVEDAPSFDVLIYVLDACRPDRIGAYGYDRPTTPVLDAVAADPDAVTYTRHYVAANWTKPATASLFTGAYVFQHGVTDLPSEVDAPPDGKD